MLSRPPVGPVAFWGVSWYAVLIVLGVLLAVWLCTREEKRLGLPRDTALDFALCAIPLGVIGARLYFVLFNLDMYLEEPLHIFAVREGGLAIFGGVLGGLLAAWITARRKKIKVGAIADMVAPGLVLAQGIGRWGNYFNMEAYGLRLRDDFASLRFFPFAVEIPVGDYWYWQMATFFYEFVVCMVAFVALMLLRKHRRRSGDIFCWYLLIYCAGRAVIEGLRTDSLTVISDSVRVSQILSALACVGALIYLGRRLSREQKNPLALLMGTAVSVLSLLTFFLGEFERNAYYYLYYASQWSGLATALLGGAACAVLWKKGKLPPGYLVPVAGLAVLWGICLVYGMGRLEADNTLYVSCRQILAMLQILLAAGLVYRALPIETEAKPEASPAPVHAES